MISSASASYKSGPQFQLPKVMQVPAKGNLRVKQWTNAVFHLWPTKGSAKFRPPLSEYHFIDSPT